MFFSPLFHTRKWFFKKVYKKSYIITDMKKLRSLERVHVPTSYYHNHWKYSFRRNRFLSCVKLIRGESFGRRKKRFALKKYYFFHFNTWKNIYFFFSQTEWTNKVINCENNNVVISPPAPRDKTLPEKHVFLLANL